MNARKNHIRKKIPLNEYPEFADRLKIAMELRNYTTAQLADSIYTSSAAISMYRNGRRMPSSVILCLIAKELEVSADFLLGLSDYIYI